MPCPRTQQANLPACSPQPTLNAERQAGKLRMPFFKVFWYDSTWEMNPRSTDCEADALTTTPSRREMWGNNYIWGNPLYRFPPYIVKSVLPSQTKFCEFALDNAKSFCVFCNKGPDSAFQVFKLCKKLLIIICRLFDTDSHTTITAPISQTQLSLNYSIPKIFSQPEADTIALLFTITNHKIWKARIAKIHENKNTNARLIATQIKKAISQRHRLELQKIVQLHLLILQIIN